MPRMSICVIGKLGLTNGGKRGIIESGTNAVPAVNRKHRPKPAQSCGSVVSICRLCLSLTLEPAHAIERVFCFQKGEREMDEKQRYGLANLINCLIAKQSQIMEWRAIGNDERKAEALDQRKNIEQAIISFVDSLVTRDSDDLDLDYDSGGIVG